MSGLTAENWMALIGTALFFTWGIAVFIFGRITVKYLEQEMAKEDILPPVWDKGIGSISITYAMIIVFPKLKPTIANYEAVRRHMRKKDKTLALFYTISFAAFMVVAFTAYFLYGPES